MADDSPVSKSARNIGVGCFTGIAGFFSGAMFAVLIAKIVGTVRKCPAGSEGQPCDWHIYAGVGAIVGAVSLPALVLWRLRRTDGPVRHSEQG
jgi:hypothetical protein